MITIQRCDMYLNKYNKHISRQISNSHWCKKCSLQKRNSPNYNSQLNPLLDYMMNKP
jgi:hypothetical protein